MADVLVLINDLIFETRIRAAAADAGVSASFAKDAALFAKGLAGEKPALAIIDLNSGPNAVEAAAQAAADTSKPRVVCFVSHVDRELAAAAKNAGAEVLPRSVFVQQLPRILLESRPRHPEPSEGPPTSNA